MQAPKPSTASDHCRVCLEQLRHVFERHVFDTSGPHNDILQFLVTCCKNLTEIALQNCVDVVNTQRFLEHVAATGNKMQHATKTAEKMGEVTRKVAMLWSASGFGTKLVDDPLAALKPLDHQLDGTQARKSLPTTTETVPLVEKPQREHASVAVTGPNHVELSPDEVMRKSRQPQKSLQTSSSLVSLPVVGGPLLTKPLSSEEEQAAYDMTLNHVDDARVWVFRTRAAAAATTQRLTAVEHVMEGMHEELSSLGTTTEMLSRALDVVDSSTLRLSTRFDELCEAMNKLRSGVERHSQLVENQFQEETKLIMDSKQEIDNHSAVWRRQQIQQENMISRISTVEKVAVSREEAAATSKIISSKNCGDVIQNLTSELNSRMEEFKKFQQPLDSLSQSVENVKMTIQRVYRLLDVPFKDADGLLMDMELLVQQQQRPPLRKTDNVVKAIVAPKKSTKQPPKTPKKTSAAIALGISGGDASQAPDRSSSEASQQQDGKKVDEDEAGQQEGLRTAHAEKILQLVHSGMPFKSIIAAVRKLNATLAAVESHQANLTRQVQQLCTTIANPPPMAPPQLSPGPPQQGPPRLGLELADGEDCVIITKVFPALPAAASGLRVGDEIVAIERRAVRSRVAFLTALSEALTLVANFEKDFAIGVLVRRGNCLQDFNIEVPVGTAVS